MKSRRRQVQAETFIRIALVGATEKHFDGIRRSLGPQAEIAWHPCLPASVTQFVACAPDVTIASFEDVDGRSTRGLMRALRDRRARTLLLVEDAPSLVDLRRVIDLTVKGIASDVAVGVAELQVLIGREVARARRRRASAAIVEVTSGRVEQSIQTALAWAAVRVEKHITVEDWAQGLGISRKTLALRFRAHVRLAPHVVLSWHRALFAAFALGQGATSIGAVARTLRLESSSDIGRIVQRHLRLRPRQLYDEKVFQAAVRKYSAELLGEDGSNALPSPGFSGSTTSRLLLQGERPADDCHDGFRDVRDAIGE